MKRTLIVTLFAALAAGFARAEPVGVDYIGLQLGRATVSVDDRESVEPSIALGRFGHFIYDDVALEARIGFGTSEETTRVGATAVDIDLQGLAGLYLVFQVPLGEAANVYAVGGVTRAAVETDPVLLDRSNVYATDFSYGAGATVHLGPRFALRAEYLAYLETIDLDLTAVTAELVYKF